MVEKSAVISLLNTLLKQTATIRKSGTQLKYYCPECRHYKKKLEISIEDGHKFGIMHCWVCGWSGNLHTLLKYLNASQSYYIQLGLLTRKIKKTKTTDNLEDLFSDIDDSPKIRNRLPDEFQPLWKVDDSFEYKHAIGYLNRRGITKCDILRHNIGFCKTGEFFNRIIIPSYDRRGNLDFYTGRAIYKTMFYTHKTCDFNKNIVGFESTINLKDVVTIVEGPFDALTVRYNSIPLFGKSLSDKLRGELLCNRPPRVNILLDNDALKSSTYICEELMKNGIIVHLIELKDKDPSVLGFSKTWEIINSTPPLTFKGLLKYKLNL